MHCERNRELYAGSADVLVRNAPTGASYLFAREDCFALRAQCGRGRPRSRQDETS